MGRQEQRLAELREQVRRIERPAATAHGVVSFDIAAIDRVLPGGGLARGALHEIMGAGGDEEDGALAAAFAAGILAGPAPHPTPGTPALAGGRPGAPLPGLEPGIAGEGMGGGSVLWCLPRPDLYGPGLAALELDPARLVLVHAARDADTLWAMEEGLRTAGLVAVVGEIGALPAVASRRLQLAAERSGVTAFVLRRWRNGAEAARERNLPSAAASRWRISALPSRPIPVPPFGHVTEPGIGCPRWRVELLRCRGGAPGCWEVEIRKGEMTDAADVVSVAVPVADRPPAPCDRAALPSQRYRRAG